MSSRYWRERHSKGNGTFTIDQDNSQADFLMQNIIELGMYSFELEEKREQSIILQSSNMLTAFSVVSAALIMAIPIVIDNTIVPKNQVLFCAAIVILLLLSSLVLSTLAQWRYKYQTMQTVDEIFNSVNSEHYNYSVQAQFDIQWKEQLSQIHNSKIKNDNKRVNLLKASMIVFWVAIGFILLSGFVLALINL